MLDRLQWFSYISFALWKEQIRTDDELCTPVELEETRIAPNYLNDLFLIKILRPHPEASYMIDVIV